MTNKILSQEDTRFIEAVDAAITSGLRSSHEDVDIASGAGTIDHPLKLVGSEAQIKAVQDAVEGHPDLQQLLSFHVQFDNVSGPVTSYAVAHWIVAQRSNSVPPVQIMARLRDFIKNRTASSFVVYVITGVAVKSRIRIMDNIELLPFDELPDHFGKHNSIDYSKTLGIEKGSLAAIQMYYEASPVILFRDDPGYSRKSSRIMLKHYDRIMQLQEITNVLSLFGRGAPVGIGAYCYSYEMPLRGVGGGTGWYPPEILQQNQTTTVVDDSLDIEAVVRAYCGLSRPRKERLAVALHRLSLAKRRRNLVDKAIELGIALESMLAWDRQPSDPISMPIRLRGAWLTAASLDERVERSKLLGTLYDFRSQAVHSGAIRPRQGQSTSRILQSGIEICSEIAKILISAEQEIDLNRVLLGSSTLDTHGGR